MTLSKNLDDLKFDKKLKVAILPSFPLNGLDKKFNVISEEPSLELHSLPNPVAGFRLEKKNPLS